MSKNEAATEIPNPCPVCGSVKYIIVHRYDTWVKCKKCNHSGPHAEKLKEAIRKWNRNDGETDR